MKKSVIKILDEKIILSQGKESSQCEISIGDKKPCFVVKSLADTKDNIVSFDTIAEKSPIHINPNFQNLNNSPSN